VSGFDFFQIYFIQENKLPDTLLFLPIKFEQNIVLPMRLVVDVEQLRIFVVKVFIIFIFMKFVLPKYVAKVKNVTINPNYF